MNKRSAAVAALLVVVGLVLFFVRVNKEMVDFEVNYKAGLRLSWGESLYRTEDGHYQFKYPPFAAMLYLPLSICPLPAAKMIWYSLLLFASVGVFYSVYRLSTGASKIPAWLSWVPLLVLGRYFFRELQLGQINVLITFILLAMTGLLVRSEKKNGPGAERGAGILWGLSVALKPYALIFLPYFLLKKKFRALSAGLAFSAISFVLPSFFYGFSGNWTVHGEWVRSLTQSTPQLLSSQDNASLLALFTKWTGRPNLAFLLWGICLILLVGLLWIVVRKGQTLENPIPLDCGLLLLLIPLISPLGWDYTFLSSVLALSLISKHYLDYSVPARIVLALLCLVIPLSLYDLLGRHLYARFMSLSIITLCFVILAGMSVALRHKRLC
jgi:hypothetical protein